MSVQPQQKRRAAASIQALKGDRPVVCLTAYTAPIAKLLDPHCDLLLVGDSLGMVIYGMESTVSVTVEMMIAHGQAVMRGSKDACVVIDLPFGSYQESKEQAFRTAARIMKETSASAVKLEGGEEMAETVAFLASRGIPVMGHIGLMPQLVNATGGYRSLGRSDAEAEKIRRDARAIDDAGAFSIVIEGTIEPVAREISEGLKSVTIGIGASAACDGQVLVSDDMLGVFTEFKPRFVKHFANLAPEISAAAAAYAEQVKSRSFPSEEHTFQIKRQKL
ncbi:3-methyl-2-oxobutanoate hydroxymethyltransferase [Rhizobium sp. SG_E_25_P2]|uniref:3-methyl-2-oxobutanoate hydroxymethyltransferase n=1 Tax=Rhizobium sp. SG_E_25_P2 TaxID=2879942 RepID=UPI0024758371|nr:3-methyl-2-oxobutanoate hydroxymethyltransferase [Rhizobium sp. SG_E_25_P2]MDH6267905.1 3-methyl-2-oxobutanoate hydroxymethyltransferase [Rhizobium sp. SG_E_25_P2]